MADELGDKIKALLSNPEAMNMFGSLLGSSSANDAPSSQSDDDEFVLNVKNAISKINSGSDRRINLLNALRPYMRETRASNIDKAVKMLKLTQLTSLFKDL